jgi:hypothetical protein
VYVSIFSDPQGKAAAIDQLAKLQGCVILCAALLRNEGSQSWSQHLTLFHAHVLRCLHDTAGMCGSALGRP